MKVLFFWHFYREYLRRFYAARPELEALPFDIHREKLLADRYSWHVDFAKFLRARGFAVEFIGANDERLQRKWAQERGFRPLNPAKWELEIALEQVRQFRPDVLWLCSHFDYFGAFARELRRYSGRVIAWVGEPWPNVPDLDGISVLVTENPDTFREAHARLEKVIVTRPGFDPGILDDLGTVPRSGGVVFVGQFTSVHRLRTTLVARLLREGIPVAVHGSVDGDPRPGWGGGARLAAWYLMKRRDIPSARDALRRAFRPSPEERDRDLVRAACRGPVFGMNMYRTLAAARAVLNVHGDIAGRHAGNMRMFEATGVGSCLITEHADNIESLFEPGREVLTYRTADDLAGILRRGLESPSDFEAIGTAGQARTLRCHTQEAVFRHLGGIFGGT